MKTTVDMHTGTPFRYNTTVVYQGKVVPCRVTRCSATHLHPSRVPAELLAELNPHIPQPEPEAAPQDPDNSDGTFAP